MDNTVPQQPYTQVPPPLANPSIPQMAPLSPFQKYKKFIIGGVILLLVIIGVIVFIFTKPNNDARTAAERHAAPDPLMAKVGDVEIYENDVVAAAQEQYSADAVTPEVFNTFLDTLIERTILDIEAERLGITVTDNEVLLASGNATSEPIRKQFKYDLLKEKIMNAQVHSVQAYMIGFWVRPLSDPHQLPIFAEQRRDGRLALSEAEVQLRADEVPVEVARSLYEKYPSLQQIWALNGYLLAHENEESSYTSPELYSFDAEALEALDDPEVYDVMQVMNVGDVRRVLRSDGSGGVVMKVVEKTPGEFADYNEYLSTRKNELITVYRLK